MLPTLINEFRLQNGRVPAKFGYKQEDENCFHHCLHMSRIRQCVHAPDYLLNGKAEAVAVRTFYRDTRETVALIIFDQFANSSLHKEILLMNNLTCAMMVDDYHVFVTVRGWD